MLCRDLLRAVWMCGVCAPVALGCAGEIVEPAGDDGVSEGLYLTEVTDSSIRGSMSLGDTTIAFDAQRPAEHVITAEVTIDEHVLAYRADGETGELSFDGGGAVLDGAQHAALQTLARELEATFSGAQDPLHKGFRSLVTYYAMAVDGMPFDAFSKQIPLAAKGAVFSGTGNDGKTCTAPGTNRTAEYDGSDGHTVEYFTPGEKRNSDFRGSNSCIGQCGSNCNGDYPWTLDCAEHDLCSYRYKSTTGAVDSNCGDEYREAADDVANPFSNACEYGWYNGQHDVNNKVGYTLVRPAHAEGRWHAGDAYAFDDYLASHPDLIHAYGYNLGAAKNHWKSYGSRHPEWRCFDCFDERRYYEKYADLRAAFGWNPQALTQHYIQAGYWEGRTDK